MNQGRLKGRAAVITGGARGIGKAAAVKTWDALGAFWTPAFEGGAEG